MNKIKFYRNKKNITVRKLSEKANIAVGYVSDLENNKNCNPTKNTMQNIAKALGESVQTVFFPDAEEEN